jgi:hypothetical protein
MPLGSLGPLRLGPTALRGAPRLASGPELREEAPALHDAPTSSSSTTLACAPLEREEPLDLCEIIRARYERGARILTSNRAIEEWYSLFPDDLMASAARDRLLHHAEVVVLEGQSYRNQRRKAS